MSVRVYYERRIWAIYLLIAINVIVYIIESISSGNFFSPSGDILVYLGQVNYLVLRWGWYWQLITSMFVHFSILHISLNMFFLYILGIQVEKRFGGLKLIALYLVTGLFGNLLSLVLIPPSSISAGASGAVFGIFGFLIIYTGVLGGNMKQMIIYGFLIFFVNIGMNINIWAHLGGMVIGMIWGYYEGKRIFRRGFYIVHRRY